MRGDPEVERVVARICQRILHRGPHWEGHRRLLPSDIGIIDAHVLSGQATAAALQESGVEGVTVRTPELWQGQEALLTVVKHPLSVGSAAPSGFDVDPGRFCVMLSRHLLGCIIVARASVRESIVGYVHDSRPTPIGARDRAWDGYAAHANVWRCLEDRGRLFTL